MLDGLKYIKGNSVFAFLISMTFFNSLFGMAYVGLMPVFAKDILEEGARGQGFLLAAGGVGALMTTLWLGSRRNLPNQGVLIIGGAVMFGLLLAAFALTSDLIGSFALALVIIFVMGVCNSTYMISIQSSLQMMVPDQMRGRVMGFYGMTWSIMPLRATQAGGMAEGIGVPLAVMTGGLLVAGFAIGPALLQGKVRNIASLLRQTETALSTEDSGGGSVEQPSPARAAR